MNKVVAVFDFDGTLIKGDSFSRFLWFCFSPMTFILKSIYSIPTLYKFAFRLADNHTAKENIFSTFFTGTSSAEFAQKALTFSSNVIPKLVKSEAIQRLRWHQEQNHQCILISASIQEYLNSWAEKEGFISTFATNMEVDDAGKLTGRFMGKNCHGPEKVQRIKDYLGSLEDYKIYAYGNSRGDKELLEIADHPFYRSFKKERVYPHE